MALYELTAAAEADIQAIARYTITTWGIEQARRYEVILESHLQAIGLEKARTRNVLKQRPELLVSRIQHHYVFHLRREMECPLILAVLHENMDFMNRLRQRWKF